MSTSMLHRAMYASARDQHELDKAKTPKTVYDDTGYHALISGKGPYDKLNNIDYLLNLMDEAITNAGATVLQVTSRAFDPQGVTILFLLGESHASIHTYPEKGTYKMDIFTCGETIKPGEAGRAIAQAIGGEYFIEVVKR